MCMTIEYIYQLLSFHFNYYTSCDIANTCLIS
uniref:Uncharacterized protein n=1 Tax=Arundo donax TaxID=35708 RepID=A0A0A9C721_ARUDO